MRIQQQRTVFELKTQTQNCARQKVDYAKTSTLRFFIDNNVCCIHLSILCLTNMKIQNNV